MMELFDLKQKLFNKKKYSQRCDSCYYGRLTADSQSVLCVKSGIMKPDHKCKSYRYDPLKRIPEKPINLQKFSAEDFQL